MIIGGILAIVVRRHVKYPLWEHRRSDEIVQIVGGTVLILLGTAGLLLFLYRRLSSN